MLIGNGALVHRQPLRLIGGGTAGDFSVWGRAERSNRMIGGFSNIFGGNPSAYRHPYAWILPIKSGALGANVTIYGTGAVSGTIIPGRNLDAAISGLGQVVNAEGQLVVSAVATLTGLGQIDTANIAGILSASATLSGAGSIDNPALGALADLIATVASSGGVNSATLRGFGNISANIIVTYNASATTEQIADAVWEALSSAHNNLGTMGAKMNSVLSVAKFLGLK